jgi:RecA/RadA recombinase
MENEDFSLSKIKGLALMVKGPYAKRFEELNITNVYDIVCRSTEELVTSTKLKKESVQKLKLRAIDYLVDKGFIDASDVSPAEQYIKDQDLENTTIPTGVKSIDTLLQGGIKKGQFYTVFGPEGSGKTQFIHNAAVQAIHKGEDVYWLEVESTFNPRRIVQIAMAKGYAESEKEAVEEYLNHIHIDRCSDSLVIMRALDQMTDKLIDNKIGLIVIDGAVGQFRLDYVGMGNLSNRQAELKTFVARLKKITQYFNIPFIMSNQVYDEINPLGLKIYHQVGGHIVGHVSTCTLQIGMKGKDRLLKLKKQSGIEPEDVMFTICDAGLRDSGVVKVEEN